jgi:hypothetical protein
LWHRNTTIGPMRSASKSLTALGGPERRIASVYLFFNNLP